MWERDDRGGFVLVKGSRPSHNESCARKRREQVAKQREAIAELLAVDPHCRFCGAETTLNDIGEPPQETHARLTAEGLLACHRCHHQRQVSQIV